MKKLIIALLIIASFTNTFAEEFKIIGNPLNSFKSQTINTCWTLAAFHYIESIVQKETGVSVSLSQDAHYWYYVFRERLIARYRNQAPLFGNLDDENLFVDMGFIAEALNVFFKYGVQFQAISENATREPYSGLKNVIAQDEGDNGYKKLRFKDFSKMLNFSTEGEALVFIDNELKKNGFVPYSNDQFQVKNKVSIFKSEMKNYSFSEWRESIKKIKILDPSDMLVWINIDRKQDLSDAHKYSLKKLVLPFSILSHSVSLEIGEQLIQESLKEGAPVPLSIDGHTKLILASAKNFYYVADSREDRIKTASKVVTYGSSIHVRQSLVKKFLQID